MVLFKALTIAPHIGEGDWRIFPKGEKQSAKIKRKREPRMEKFILPELQFWEKEKRKERKRKERKVVRRILYVSRIWMNGSHPRLIDSEKKIRINENFPFKVNVRNGMKSQALFFSSQIFYP